jgi:hypothetical protein
MDFPLHRISMKRPIGLSSVCDIGITQDGALTARSQKNNHSCGKLCSPCTKAPETGKIPWELAVTSAK